MLCSQLHKEEYKDCLEEKSELALLVKKHIIHNWQSQDEPEQHTNLLVSGSSDGTAKLWRPDGTVATTLQAKSPVLTVTCSGNGQYIATSSQDNFVKLWKPDGTLIETLYLPLIITCQPLH